MNATDIDKSKIKKSISGGYIDGIRNSFSNKVDKNHASMAIDQAIDLAIEKTLREVEQGREELRQKLISDIKEWAKDFYKSHLYIEDLESIINRRFEVENEI